MYIRLSFRTSKHTLEVHQVAGVEGFQICGIHLLLQPLLLLRAFELPDPHPAHCAPMTRRGRIQVEMTERRLLHSLAQAPDLSLVRELEAIKPLQLQRLQEPWVHATAFGLVYREEVAVEAVHRQA